LAPPYTGQREALEVRPWNQRFVSVEARVQTTDPDLNVRLATAGVGLTIIYERTVRPHVEAGTLVPVLEKYSEPFPGFFLYFPRRRHRSAALRALIDFVRGEVRV